MMNSCMRLQDRRKVVVFVNPLSMRASLGCSAAIPRPRKLKYISGLGGWMVWFGKDSELRKHCRDIIAGTPRWGRDLVIADTALHHSKRRNYLDIALAFIS
jgi:hypothetical protein